MSLFLINDELLFSLNKKGLFPSPGEFEKDFIKRAHDLYLKNPFSNKLFNFIPLQKLFDIQPDWVDFKYTNQGLSFWEAACVEIRGDRFVLKLKKKLEHRPLYWGLYSVEEIGLHECCHVSRMAFREERFEEMFAYHTSNSLRKIWGPLFRSRKEIFALIVSLLLSVAGDLFAQGISGLWWLLKLAPCLVLLSLTARLFINRRIFYKCQRALGPFLKNKEQTLAVMFRLSDKEIISFSKKKSQWIKNYINMQRDSLRWKVIRHAYFK